MEQAQISPDSTPTLTDWKNPPSLMALKQDLQDALPYHDTQTAKIERWLDNLHVRNKAVVDAPKGRSKIVPRLIRKQAEWRYAALSEPFLSTPDIFNVYPASAADKKAAIQNELVLNHQFNTYLNKVKFVDEYVRTAVDEGTVILRVGWVFEEEEYLEEIPVYEFQPSMSVIEDYARLDQMAQQNPEMYQSQVPPHVQQAHQMSVQSGIPLAPVQTGTRTEKRTRTLKNHPTVDICNYKSVIVDPSCQGDLEKAGFIIYRFETSLSELKKDGRYKNLDQINLEANSILSISDAEVDNTASHNFNFTDSPRKKFYAYEYWGYWDIQGTGIVKPFVATWVGDVLIRMEEAPFPDKKLPFIGVHYLPVRKSTHGEPDGALLEDNQKIIGAVTRGMIDIMGRSANGQIGMRKDLLDVTNRRKFDAGKDYEFNANVDPRQGIIEHKYPEIPASAQFMVEMQNAEAESLTGVKAFSGGISSQSLGDVAAGIRGALDASSKRELGILRRLAAGVTELGRRIIAMNSEWLSDQEVIRITDEEFVTVQRDDLAGHFDLRLSISTAEEDNNKAMELSFMLQTMGNNMDPVLSKMILADIARLRKMPDLAKRIETYEPQPDPMQQEMQMLNLELLRAQVLREQAEGQLAAAKIRTEQAKAMDLTNSADLKNLDFVEQETGVKQERELQKAGEQARSQAGLAILKHGFDLQKEKVKQKGK